MNYQDNVHTTECHLRHRDWQKQVTAFTAKWPNYCRDCNSTGEVYDLFEEGDFCEGCIGSDQCPRCSGPFMYRDGNSRCPTCGWEMGEEFLDQPPDCDCDEQLRAALEGEP
jgi:hypothetical protein